VGPRIGLDIYGKFRPPSGFDPRTVQLIANRHADYAVTFKKPQLIIKFPCIWVNNLKFVERERLMFYFKIGIYC